MQSYAARFSGARLPDGDAQIRREPLIPVDAAVDVSEDRER
ncbi:MAG TPA: hypothetical protein VNE83_07570 [Terriglobales bacterium]|nr:hypothetical protein [Terriglobales bacterium]